MKGLRRVFLGDLLRKRIVFKLILEILFEVLHRVFFLTMPLTLADIRRLSTVSHAVGDMPEVISMT